MEGTRLTYRLLTFKLLDWLIRTFHIYFRSFGQRGLVVAVVLTSIPLALNLSSIIIFIFHVVIPGLFFKTGFIGTGGLAFLNYGLIDAFLEGEFVKRKRKIEGGYSKIFYLIAPTYFAGSIYLFIYSFRFL